jgi:hypothetical protein
MAAQLTLESRKRFFDLLMAWAMFERPIRAVTPADGYLEGVESRTVPFEGGYLTYLHNESDKDVTVKLFAAGTESGKSFAEIFCVNTEEKIASPTMKLAPYETRIMKIKLK